MDDQQGSALRRTTLRHRKTSRRRCTVFVLSDMPEGKYGTKYDQDQNLPAGKSYVKATVK